MTTQKYDWSDLAQEAASWFFVAVLVCMSVAGAYFAFPEKYFAVRCVAAALAFVIDMAAIACFKKMMQYYGAGADKSRFWLNFVCWAAMSAVTIGSATMCAQWILGTANQQHEVHQQEVANAQKLVEQVNTQRTATDPQQRKAANAASGSAQAELRTAMSKGYESVQHIAYGNEWQAMIGLFLLSYFLRAAAGKGEEEQAQVWLPAKDITFPQVQNLSSPVMPPFPPKGKALPAKQVPEIPAKQGEIPSGATVSSLAAYRQGKTKPRTDITAEAIADLLATMTQQQIATHYGCDVKTIGNRLRAARKAAQIADRQTATA